MAEMSVDDLTVLVPSRGRPENIRRLAEAWNATTTGSSALIVIVDGDDPARQAYEDLGVWDPEGSVHLLLWGGARRPLGPLLNYFGYAFATESPTTMIGFMGDDHLPRSVGWDYAVLATWADLGSCIVYGDDLLQGEKLPTAAFMSADIIRTLRGMCPPTLEHLYIDNAWLELGRAMGRLRYLPDVVIEHLHPAAGKAQHDQTYAEANHPDRDRRDKAAFEVWRRAGLPRDLELLRAAGIC